MNGFERMGALMQGQLPDRVPIVCNLLEQGAKELNLSIKDYYKKGEYVAEGQIKMQKKYGYDHVWGFFHTATIAQLWGSKNVIYSELGPPNVGHMVIKDFKDIENLDIPDDIENMPAFQEWAKCIKILKSENLDVPIFSCIVSAFTLPNILMGIEKWLTLLFNGPESLVKEIIEKGIEFNYKLLKTINSLGVAMTAYSNPFASMDFLNVTQFEQRALPWIKQEFDKIGRDNIVYFNGGGPINPTIPLLFEQAGLGAYYLHPNDDILEAKNHTNNQAIIAGTINDILLISMKPHEIREKVKEIMEIGKPGGGFIFGTLVMPYLIPDENISVLVEAAKEYGAY